MHGLKHVADTLGLTLTLGGALRAVRLIITIITFRMHNGRGPVYKVLHCVLFDFLLFFNLFCVFISSGAL